MRIFQVTLLLTLFATGQCIFTIIGNLLQLALLIGQQQEAKNKPPAQNPYAKFECVAVYAQVRCGTEDGGAVVQLVDDDGWPYHETMDQTAFSAKHAPIILSGCADDDGDGKIDPELVIIHTCKGPKAKRVRIPLPRSAVFKFTEKLKYHKITEPIDLKGTHQIEEDWPVCPKC